MTKKSLLKVMPCSLVALCVFFFVMLLNDRSASATCTTDANTGVVTCSESASATVRVAEACTMVSTVNTPHEAELTNGLYSGGITEYTNGIGKTTIKVTCNDASGFSVYAIGYTGNEYGNNKLMTNVSDSNAPIINTGTNDSGSTSSWSMKVTPVTGTYQVTSDNSFNNYHNVPTTYTRVAYRTSGTDVGNNNPEGSSLEATYAAYISPTQPSGTYQGQVKYTLVHPNTNTPQDGPRVCVSGYICYYPNTNTYEGSMGRQRANSPVTLFASNFSKPGYGFAGWSDKYDWETNPDAHFYGPNESITVPSNGFSLYAVWIPSAGSFQDSAKVSELCGTGANALTSAAYSDEGDDDESTWSITAGLSSISALTDTRDNQTYAIAKLTDGNCWMIENLRLDNTAILTTINTNNPLNDSDPTNPTVTLKHNYSDTTTHNTLSPSSSVAYDATTSPEGWCTDDTAACDNQSRLRTDNTTNRSSYTATQSMYDSAKIYSYGNYYNWYSATAGRGVYSDNLNSVTVGDLCPAGWHLPTGTGSGEFGLLSNSLGGYQDSGVSQAMTPSTSPSGTVMGERIRHFPNNFIISGEVNGGDIVFLRSYAFYWSGTNISYGRAYNLYFYNGTVYAGSHNYFSNKYRGGTIRCIASPGSGS